MPIERHRYPAHWDDLSRQLKTAAGWVCQRCGQACRRPGESLADFGQRVFPHPDQRQIALRTPQRYCLTVAHLDQNPANNAPDNLLCLCVPCHLAQDRPFRVRNLYAKRERRGQLPLDLGEQPMVSPFHPDSNAHRSPISSQRARHESRA